MRILSFVLAFVSVVAGPSMAGSIGKGVPGIGTFAYSGSPAMTFTPTLVVASR